MKTKTVVYEEVLAAIQAIEIRQEAITVRRVREVVGRGSMQTIMGFIARYQATPKSAPLTGLILSEPSTVLREYLHTPIELRAAVKYNREVVDSYIPNRSFFLSGKLRAHLGRIGKMEKTAGLGTYSKEVMSRLLIDLSWASSKLEGNTYSLLDTQKLIESGIEASDKSRLEAVMILNHKRAIEYLVDMGTEARFSPLIVRGIHACLSMNLLKNEADVGSLRNMPVSIGGSVYTPLSDPTLINEVFTGLLSKANQIQDPFEQSFFALLNLAYLQPFIDVNKRTSRICANIPFVRNGLSPLSFVGVSDSDYIEGVLGFYEKNDASIMIDVFEWAYEQSAARYSAFKEAFIPSAQQIKHRGVIEEAVRIAVKSCNHEISSLPESVGDEEQAVLEIANRKLAALHEGVLVSYSITEEEFERYRASLCPAP